MLTIILYALPYVFIGLGFWCGWLAREIREPTASIRKAVADLGDAVLANADHTDHGARH